MKRWISGLLALALVLTLFTPTMLPAFAASSQSGKVNYSAVHLRDKPWGTILDLIYQGAWVEVYGSTQDSDGDSWYEVSANGKSGYMYADYIDLESTSSTSKEETKDDSLSGSLKVTWDFARVRSTPWGEILGQLNRGQSADVTGQTRDSSGDIWYKVNYQGKTGYMHEENVAFTRGTSSGSGSSSTEPKPTAPNEESVTGSLKVTWDFARVRSTPWGTILGQLNRGESAEVTGKTKDSAGEVWYEVKYQGKTGYMHEENVSFTAGKPTTPSEPAKPDKPKVLGSLRVNYSVLNVREKPNTSSKIVTTISDLTVHDYTEETRDSRGDMWYKIDKGWVHGDYVDLGPQKVTSINVILSTLEYTGDPINISANAIGTTRALYRISIKQGTSYKVLSEFSDKNSANFTPTAPGEYTVKVEARDVKASGVEKTFEQSFTLKKDTGNHSYNFVEYGSLEAFARSQVGRATKWEDGYWVDASFEEILKEMTPQDALTFSVPKANPSSETTMRIIDYVNVRSGAGTSNSIYGVAGPGETYKVLASTKVNGETWYKINYEGKEGWFHSDFAVDASTGKAGPSQDLGSFVTIISNGTALRKTASSSASVIGYLAAKSSYMVLDRSGSWIKIQHKGSEGWIQNTEAYGTDEVNTEMYQFLDLRGGTGISAAELNKVLKGKGILEGQGEAFVEASRLHNINEIYLVSHAILETGGGSSALATGQVVEGLTVYNMYGIGAYDSDPVGLGAKTAYNEGWTSPQKAIIDGAKWISKAYVHNDDGQYTLYKMRYNYLDTGFQYATDIAWAKSQTSYIKTLYGQVTGYNLRFEIPIYTDR